MEKKPFFISCLLLWFATAYSADHNAQEVQRMQPPHHHIIAQLPDARTVFLQVRTEKVENDTGQQPNFVFGALAGALQHALSCAIAPSLTQLLTEFNSNLFATKAELTEEKKKKDADEHLNLILNQHTSVATNMELLERKQKMIALYKGLINHDPAVLAKLEGELNAITKELEISLSNDLDKFHAYVKSLKAAHDTAKKK